MAEAERPGATEARARASRFRPKRLDHVALWVADREGIARFASEHLGMHVIQRTDAFTLVGADARRGKLTLFEAEGGRERGLLEEIGLRVNDLEQAARGLPADLQIERGEGALRLALSDSLQIALVEGATQVDFDLDHVTLRSPSPLGAAASYAGFGFEPAGAGAPALRLADVSIELVEGDPGLTQRPLLNHLGLLVDSAQEHVEVAESEGVEVLDVVDAPNTLAVFVAGPDGIKLEYVEHKPGFSLE